MSKDLKHLIKRLWYFSAFDGGLYRVNEAGSTYFAMNMVSEHLDYVNKVQKVFQDLGIGFTIYDRKDYNDDGHIRKPQVRAQSARHPKRSYLGADVSRR